MNGRISAVLSDYLLVTLWWILSHFNKFHLFLTESFLIRFLFISPPHSQMWGWRSSASRKEKLSFKHHQCSMRVVTKVSCVSWHLVKIPRPHPWAKRPSQNSSMRTCHTRSLLLPLQSRPCSPEFLSHYQSIFYAV